MKYGKALLGTACALAAVLWACEPLDDDRETHVTPRNSIITLEEVAELLSSVPLEKGQMEEVMDAASASAQNGYDEEYRMQDLFSAPGTGVGSEADTKAGERYATPLRDLLSKAVRQRYTTKAGGEDMAMAYLDSLMASDVQIYWPYSEEWDGKTLPVVTFDPGDAAEENLGYALCADGSMQKVMGSSAYLPSRLGPAESTAMAGQPSGRGSFGTPSVRYRYLSGTRSWPHTAVLIPSERRASASAWAEPMASPSGFL